MAEVEPDHPACHRPGTSPDPPVGGDRLAAGLRWHLEAHHSTALEGNTLVLKEVQVLLDQGRAVGAKPAGDYGALGELVARAMEENLNRFIVPNVAGPARLVPLAALTDKEFSIDALRQAAQRGRLNAVQGADGVWRSSRKSVEAYHASKHKPTKPRAKRRLSEREIAARS